MLKVLLILTILPLFDKSPVLPNYPEKQVITQDTAKEALLPPAVDLCASQWFIIKVKKSSMFFIRSNSWPHETVSCFDGDLSDAVWT
ncbi:MAG: hypothetical protein WC719_04060 [Patescibacteria group bacterium]|jgi:hypothetical protein